MVEKVIMDGKVYEESDHDLGRDVFMDHEDDDKPIAYPSAAYAYEMELDGFRFVLPKTAHDFAVLAHEFASHPCTDHYLQVTGWEQPHYIVLVIMRGDEYVDAFEIHDGGEEIVPAYMEHIHRPSEAAITAIRAWCQAMGLSMD